MKKFATLTLIILSLFSCVFFSACGDKYKNLQMEIIFTDGSAVNNLELVLDSNDSSKATKRLGVKFLNIDADDVGQVVIYSSPSDVFVVSNEVYSENYFYFDVTAIKVADSESKLIVKHLSSGKTTAVGLKIDQKAQNLTSTSNKYIVAVNGVNEGGTKTHFLNSKTLVNLQPATSTDKVYFKETTTNNTIPSGVTKITETIDGVTYITGFKISSNTQPQQLAYKLIPVTKMDGYKDDVYTQEVVEIYFSKCLNSDNVGLDTDDYHKDENGNIYETIYLIANDTTDNNGKYSYNNVLFNLTTSLETTGDISTYLNDYIITTQDNSTAIQSSHTGNGNFVVQAIAITDKVETVDFILTPKNIVGDVEVITKSVKVKGEVRSNTIETKKKDIVINTNEIVDIYNYVSLGNTNGIKFNFKTISNGNIAVFNDLSKMRIEISPEILYLNSLGGYYTNILTENREQIESTTLKIGNRDLANQKKLISLFKGNEYLQFTYDSVKEKFVSDLFSASDNLYIKYIETSNTKQDTDLSIKVTAGYEGNLNYLKDIKKTTITLKFEALEGVVSLDVFASSQQIEDDVTTHSPIKNAETEEVISAQNIYIDKSKVSDTLKYELMFTEDSIKGLGNRKLTSDVEFDVNIYHSSSIINPISLDYVNKLLINDLSSNVLYVKINVDSNTSIGEYIIVLSQPDTGFEKKIYCYIYKELSASDLKLNFANGDLNDEAFKNSTITYNPETKEYEKTYTYTGYKADYIVYAGKSLNLYADINADVLNSNIVKNYVYTPVVLNKDLEVSNNIPVENYFNREIDPLVPAFSKLNFINKGTIYEGEIYYIAYNVEIQTRKFTNILQEDLTDVNKTSVTIIFFVYERIVDGTNIRASLNYPVLEKYMIDYLGYNNQNEGIANLNVNMNDDNLWNYVQPSDEHKVNWEHNLGAGSTSIEFANQKDKSIDVIFKKNGNLDNYNCNIIAKIKQFNKTIELRSSVLVKKPILTEKLNLTNNIPTFEKISRNTSYKQIFEYNLDMRMGEEFIVTAGHTSSIGNVTHSGVTLVVANAGGGTIQDAIEVNGNTIKVKGIQSNLHLIVYSTDVLNCNVNNYTSGFDRPELYILEGEDPYEDMYKGAYFIINLHLEDGNTKETAYRVYNLHDFEEMLNSTETNKYYQIMNDINLTGLSTFNNEFTGNIFSDNNCTLYDVNLNNSNVNLFKTFTGTIENVNFEIKYNYANPNTSSNLGLIGRLESTATITNIGATITGSATLSSGVNFGGLVGVNNGTIKYENNNCGITVEISLFGNTNINFGGLVGLNNATISGVNENKTEFNGATEVDFASSTSTQGAVGNIIINANSLSGTAGAIGGLVGENKGTISKVYVIGTINAKNYNNVGGVVGSSSVGETGVYKYDNGTISYTGTESPVLTDVKSGVVVNGYNNVGGIVGADSYGLYYNCWYQILPSMGIAISGNEKVGGIVGYANHSKLQFCSVMSYKYDYSSNENFIASLTNKDSDIVGVNYVAGLVGFVETNAITLDNITDGITNSTIIRNSSVNAVVEATKTNEGNLIGAVAGIYTTSKESISGFIHSSYFIGKLVGCYTCYEDTTTILGSLCLDNNGSGVYNYCYTLNFVDSLKSGKTKENNFKINNIVDDGDLLGNWNKYTGVNLDYIYVSNNENAINNQPIFDIVPTSFAVNEKINGGQELNLYYYDFSLNGIDETTLNNLNRQFNVYNILDKLAFAFAPASKIMVQVTSSDTNILVVDAKNGSIQVLATGSAILTFTPVLNPNLKVEIEVNVTKKLSNIVVSQDGVNSIKDLEIAKDKTKQLQTYSIGTVEYNGVIYSYKSSNEYGLLVSIKWKSGVTDETNKYYKDNKIISNYIKVNNATVISCADSKSEYLLFVPYGTPLSFTATQVGGDFNITIQACVDKTLPEKELISKEDFTQYTDATATLNLKTMQGAYGISFDYDYAIVYPNDETNLIATISTDIKLEENEINALIYSIVLNYNGVEYVNYNDYIELISAGRFDSDRNIQVVTFKVKINESFAETKDETPLKINFKTKYTSVKTVEYTILPQRIDKIETKSYIKNGTEYEDSDILKPNNLGMLAIDISPINGYFSYLEIDDVTGNEEIKFIQLNSMGGNSLFEVDTPSRLNKGIRLVKVDGQSTIYVSMQIDKKYNSKLHTLKVTAYSKNGTALKTDYKYIDVKMLPIVNVEYQLPNGESKFYETQTTNTIETVDNLYFAIGTSAQFRITTANATGDVKYSILSESTCSGTFTFVNTHNDFYTLTNTVINSSDLGKKVIVQLQAESVIGNNIETATLNLEFTIVKYVIHGVSVTSSNSKGEIYGNFNIPTKLEFYLKATDISFYNNGTYHDTIYKYDSNIGTTNGSTQQSINAMLFELNNKAEDYIILNYGYNSGYNRVATEANETNKYLSTKLVNGVDKLINNEPITFDNNTKELTVKNHNNEGVLVEYDRDCHLAVDMELTLNTSNYMWTVQTKVTESSIDLSKNYLLNFNKAYEEDDYQLIRNEEDFLAITDGESNRYILGNDLVLENYSPIDVNIAEFDGNGRTITIKSFALFTEEVINAGLFKQVYENMLVKNVNVEYVSTRTETVYSFGYVKTNDKTSKVKDFTVEYSDICNDYTVNYTQATFGGLTAVNNGIITNCTVAGQIAMRASTIETNKTTSVKGYDIAFNIGGLVGENSSTGYITHSSSGLKIFALANIGGLVYKNEGKISSSAVEDEALIYSYNINLEKTIVVNVGGFVADNAGSISMSHTTLIYNYAEATDTAKEIYKGFMSTKDESAGFAYTNSGSIKNCYVQISKIGDHNNVFCGFVYSNSGAISTCYTDINKGNHNDSNVFMFSQTGTKNLENCLEFVYIKTGYAVNQSTGLTSVDYGLIANDRQKIITVFEKNNFMFGSTNSAVWTMENVSLPLLVACEDKVRYLGSQIQTGNNYYGLRNLIYSQEQIKNDDGTTSLEWKVKFDNDSYGKSNNPFIIANLSNWDNRFYNNSTNYYRIVSDIEFSSYLNPTTSTEVFSGNIQGNDMILSNIKLYLQEDVEAIGLFKSLTSADDINIENSVRNLTLKITSGWASKADAFGSLSGEAIGFNLYNITVDNANEVLVGGNAVGGVVGYLAGKFDVDGIVTNIGVNSTRELSAYRYNIYQGTNNLTTSNLSNVYYAGSAFGIAEGYDATRFDINKERIINSKYYTINHVTVNEKPILIGDTVGAVCGFVGEKVKLINSNVNLTGANFKGYQYSAGLVGENRGVIDNAIVTIGTNSFNEANYTAAGLVGLNLGGLIRNVDVTVDIIRSGNVSVGGIVAKNINGTISNASFDGQIYGNITGVIMASNYSYDIFAKNTGIGALKDTTNVDKVVPNKMVEYKETLSDSAIKFENLVISEKCLMYFIENVTKFYSYQVVISESAQTLVQENYRAFGLFAGTEYTGNDKKSTDIKVYYDKDNKVILNGKETENSIKKEPSVENPIKVKCEQDKISFSTDEDALMWKTTQIRTFEKDISYLATIYIVGADVTTFDTWDRKEFTSNFVVFGKFN